MTGVSARLARLWGRVYVFSLATHTSCSQNQSIEATLQGKRGRRLDFLDDDARTDAIHACHPHQLLEEELLERLMVGDDDLHQVIEFAGEEMALEHLRHARDGAGKLLERLRAVVREHDMN